MSIPAATLDKPLGKFFKDVCMQNGRQCFKLSKKAYSAISKIKAALQYPPRWRIFSFQGSVGSQTKKSCQTRTSKQAKCVPWINNRIKGKVVWERRIWLPQPLSTSGYIVVVLFPSLCFQARDESRKLCVGDLEQQNDPETGKEILVLMAERGSKAWKVLTSDSATQKYSQREQKDARSGSLNFLKAIFQKRQRLQVIRFSLP